MKNEISLSQYIGYKIRYYRKQKSLTQEQLSVDAGLDPKFVNRLENNFPNVTLSSIEKLLRTMDISYSEFFEGNNVVESEEFLNFKTLLEQRSEEDRQEILNSLNKILKK
ncbi:helix-turn-helix domain-containing protein [Streptococcus pluranimalium]|uniref:helix-turn-helix domain-containing protein n=1 Tax=Streptococcus pluranimalium TaxID=82348 RepID=UPI003F674DA7